MKAFIYLSVLLIAAGSAFGLADYFKEKNKGTFDKLYVEQPLAEEEEDPAAEPAARPVAQPAINTVQTTTPAAAVTAAPAKAAPVKKKVKKVVRRPKISFREFSRSAMPRRFVREEPETVQPEPAAVPVTAPKPGIE